MGIATDGATRRVRHAEPVEQRPSLGTAEADREQRQVAGHLALRFFDALPRPVDASTLAQAQCAYGAGVVVDEPLGVTA